MESKTGSLLAKIAGIIELVAVFVLLTTGIAMFFETATKESIISSAVGGIIEFVLVFVLPIIGIAMFFIIATKESIISSAVGGIIFIVIAIVVLVFALLFLKASRMMKIRERTRGGAVLSLVIGILSATSIAGILGIIGGAIGLSDSKK